MDRVTFIAFHTDAGLTDIRIEHITTIRDIGEDRTEIRTVDGGWVVVLLSHPKVRADIQRALNGEGV